MYSFKKTLKKAAVAFGAVQGIQTAVSVPKTVEEGLTQIVVALATAGIQGFFNWLKNKGK